jgi:magnesium transporter
MKTMEAPGPQEKIFDCQKEGKIERVKEAQSLTYASEIDTFVRSLDQENRSRALNSSNAETSSRIILELEKEQKQEILVELDHEKITKKYPENTAGGIMQTELVQVIDDSTVRDAVAWIRPIADEVQVFYGIYVTDEGDGLLGTVFLKRLILANPMMKVREIMEPIIVTIAPYVGKEEVTATLKKYHIVSLPVVDEGGRLLGRITTDDANVIKKEASEDIYRFAEVGEYSHLIYTPNVTRMKLGSSWLLLTILGELFATFVIAHVFNPTLELVVILAVFMPVIMAAGGNIGLRATTVMIRGLGMGRIPLKRAFKVIVSEMRLGLSLGIMCGIITSLIGALIGIHGLEVIKIPLSIFVAISSATLATTFMGVAEPFVLLKLKLDPIAARGHFITVLNNICGSIVYLFIATVIF